MQAAVSKSRRLSAIFKPSVFSLSVRGLPPGSHSMAEPHPPTSETRRNHSFMSSLGFFRGSTISSSQNPIILRASYSSEASAERDGPSDAVKEIYDAILDSVNNKRTMAPNAWTWSLIEKCQNHQDIKLLFDALQNLRRFRLSNLRIHDNFNCNLCREVTKACIRVGALDFAKRALWKHNVFGLTPTIGSVHQLLQYAKENNDIDLLKDVMKLLKKNGTPLQPGTADIVFSICSNLDKWKLMTKYGKRFVKAGVKLHKPAFDMWMDHAVRMGDVESLWKIEKFRSESTKQHTIGSAFSCAKGLILEHKPEEAAAIISVVNQGLPEEKRPQILAELKKLVNEWPLELIKRKKEEESKALATALESDIRAVVSALGSSGLELMA
ncbi:hypothetical protein MLD38_023555 [Melastoma candidum]|uniref:Uncharacterized protein n=1 Tax=Melastoma candidum TaxID=119954 RepID=A0ACB9NUG8_9MYRT|nr:hypothetical protein MLD38_023555 [Melastoma candidum]